MRVSVWLLLMCMIDCATTKNPVLETDKEIAENWSRIKSRLSKYGPHIRPGLGGNATHVAVDMTILRIGRIDEIKKTYILDMFFRQEWRDTRLRHNLSCVLTPFMGTEHPSMYIWTPDTTFHDELDGHNHVLTTHNHKVDIYADGLVRWGCRLTVTVKCSFDFRNYPMDIQKCQMGLESYSYPVRHLRYSWKGDGVWVSKEGLPSFQLKVGDTEHEVKTYVIGNYSVLTTSFEFERRIAFSILSIFLPCVTLVFVSWIALWFYKTCVSARMGLGVFPILTLCKLWQSTKRSLPEVDYITAVDIYMVTSFTFIAVTIFEYAIFSVLGFGRMKRAQLAKKLIVLSDKRHLKRKISRWAFFRKGVQRSPSDESCRRPPRGCYGSQSCITIDNRGRMVSQRVTRREEKDVTKRDYIELWRKDKREERPYYYKPYPVTGKTSAFDNAARLLFPFFFLCFNLVFWVTYHQQHTANAHRLKK